MTKSRSEILGHLAEACFGHGRATGAKLRALNLMDRLVELQQAENNFGTPRPFSGELHTEAVKIIERWRNEEHQARINRDMSFFQDVARALKYLKADDDMVKLNADTREGVVMRLTAFKAFRMISSREELPFREELISGVEYQIATDQFRTSPLNPIPLGASNPTRAVRSQLASLRERRRAKTGINWRRILTKLWLFDFLPTR